MTEENIRPQSLNFFKLEDNTMFHWAHHEAGFCVYSSLLLLTLFI